jgi:hypothetical protein
MEKRRRRRKVVLLRKRLGLSEHSFWSRVSVSRRRDRQQYERSPRKTRNVSGKLSLVNARGLWICKIRYAIATPPLLSLPFAADTFVALRPNGRASEPDGLVENLLFGAGLHLFLVPGELKPITPFETVIVAWNGSRESARALAEAVPYLHEAR